MVELQNDLKCSLAAFILWFLATFCLPRNYNLFFEISSNNHVVVKRTLKKISLYGINQGPGSFLFKSLLKA
jgi:hypothetical protein